MVKRMRAQPDHQVGCAREYTRRSQCTISKPLRQAKRQQVSSHFLLATVVWHPCFSPDVFYASLATAFVRPSQSWSKALTRQRDWQPLGRFGLNKNVLGSGAQKTRALRTWHQPGPREGQNKAVKTTGRSS